VVIDGAQERMFCSFPVAEREQCLMLAIRTARLVTGGLGSAWASPWRKGVVERLAAGQLDDAAGQAVADLLAQMPGSSAQPGRA
jgi:hypothetical protein